MTTDLNSDTIHILLSSQLPIDAMLRKEIKGSTDNWYAKIIMIAFDIIENALVKSTLFITSTITFWCFIHSKQRGQDCRVSA